MSFSRMFSWLRSWLQQPAHIHIADIRDFPEISADRIATELSLVDKAKTRGAENLPPPDQKDLDAVERLILDKLKAARRDALLTGNERLATYNGRLSALDFTSRISEITHIASTAPGKFEAEAQLGRNELFKKREDLSDHHKSYKIFRERQGIYAPPKILAGWDWGLKMALLAAVFVIEVALNAQYFGLRDAMGYAGGLLQAVTLAVVNIGTSCLVSGVGIRRINDKSVVMKLVGYSSLLFYIAFFMTWNLWVGHFREALSFMQGNAGLDAVQSFKSNPIGLKDFDTWVLVALGMLFSVISCVDIYFMYDPHWGYSAKKEALDAAHDEYIYAFESAQSQLSEKRDETIMSLREAARDLEKRTKEYFDIHAKKQVLRNEYLKFQDNLEEISGYLFSLYRDENIRSRTAPPPEYFGKKVGLRKIDLDDRDDYVLSNIDSLIASTHSRIEEKIETINGVYEASIKTLKEITVALETVQ